MIETIKMVIAALVFIAGVYGYYELPTLLGQDVSILIRFGLLLVSLLVAVAIVLMSENGKRFLEFYRGSMIELKKMIWPTKAEARQTTIVVLILVVVVAAYLWMVDALAFNAIYDWLLGIES